MCLGCGTVHRLPSFFHDNSEGLKESEFERTVNRE